MTVVVVSSNLIAGGHHVSIAGARRDAALSETGSAIAPRCTRQSKPMPVEREELIVQMRDNGHRKCVALPVIGGDIQSALGKRKKRNSG